VQTAGDYLDVYFDDFEINGAEESFDIDPKWATDGNPVEYEQRVWRPYHEIGYSFTSHTGGRQGEIGGIMFRDEQPMYYADRIGLPQVLADIRRFHAEHGFWWQPAPLLERLVAEGKNFADLQPEA